LDEAVVLCVAEIGIQKVILEGDAEAVIEAANRNQTHLQKSSILPYGGKCLCKCVAGAVRMSTGLEETRAQRAISGNLDSDQYL
jgi:hypothetical protein